MWVHGWAWWGGGVCETSQIVYKTVSALSLEMSPKLS